jgi:hypothetical protein
MRCKTYLILNKSLSLEIQLELHVLLHSTSDNELHKNPRESRTFRGRKNLMDLDFHSDSLCFITFVSK